jgi:hypothetical protein
MEQPIYATNWYSLTDSVIIPTQKAAELFYNSNYVDAAREIGRYSSEVALKGIYKIFVRVSSPHFVLSRASSIFSTYYQPSDIKIIESSEKKAVLQLSKFHPNDKLIMNRIAGWIEKTLEITLQSAIKIDIENHVEGTNLTSSITIMWS